MSVALDLGEITASVPHGCETQRWYCFDNESCIGPIPSAELVALIMAKRVSGRALVIRDGWRDWRSIIEVLDELSDDAGARKSREVYHGERRIGGPRVNLSGQASILDGERSLSGNLRNISAAGIFVGTREPLFAVGSTVKLHVSAAVLGQPFSVVADVKRFTAGCGGEAGYGLQFLSISQEARDSINRLVDSAQKDDDGEVSLIKAA